MSKQKQGGCPKQSRFGGKQLHGHSRASYFAQAPFRIARNKARRIAKDLARQVKQKTRQQQ